MPDPTGRISHINDMHRGFSWKPAARFATTANITLSGPQTVDGVAAVAEDIGLVKNQTAGAQNGLYIVKAGAWVRHPSMDQDGTSSVPAEEVMGAVIKVIAGTVNVSTVWQNTNTTAPTLGTTALTFTLALGATTVSALDDLTDVVITSAATADRLRYNGTNWVNSSLIWQPLTDGVVAGPALIFDAGDVVMTES